MTCLIAEIETIKTSVYSSEEKIDELLLCDTIPINCHD